MELTSLDDVLTMEIQDLYSAENQILEALPKMIPVVSSSKLREGFEKHLYQTKEHVKRLEEAAESIGIDPKGKKCKGMEGLLKEGEELLTMAPCAAVDAAMIGVAQRVEHYEIAGYGCAITFAKLLDHSEAVEILKKTIAEEEDTDKTLTRIAETEVNKKAENEA